ncbi:MAG: hypothetical protein ACKV22_27000 [Bryobacteraceae bacterium]
MNIGWKCVYELDQARGPVGPDAAGLADAIRRAADLRIYTEFRHNEHIDLESGCDEKILEVSDFRVTYLVEDRWTAGIMSLRQPVALPSGFGPRPSMSFFLYNQDGTQAIARPYLDGAPPGPEPNLEAMARYHKHGSQDAGTNAPSHNFVYDFDVYRFCVADGWEEVLHHSPEGEVLTGSVDRLAREFVQGREVKVGIRNLCAPFGGLDHEVFVQTGPGYYYTERKLFLAETQPVVRVKTAIPMRYESGCWDFGWLLPRTDGVVAHWMVDPYTLRFVKSESRHSVRWFVR